MKSLFERKTLFFIIGFLGVFTLVSFLGMNKHSNYSRFTYRSELWSDKSGYYIYLPALTLYDFDASALPDSIDEKMGTGFNINQEENKLENQYSVGLALLWSPFYGVAHGYAKMTKYEANGFTKPYHKFLNFASAFYFSIATFLLFLYFRRHGLSYTSIFITYLAILLGTNAYYYLVDENGMTHIYSFSLIVFSLYISDLFFQRPNLKKACLIGILSGLLVLLRPTNLILLILVVFLNAQRWDNVLKRFQILLKPKYLLSIAIPFFLIWVPQFLYWHYLSGSFIFYSYEHRGFDNLADPQIINVLFNPFNGLLPNAPVVLLTLIATVWLYFHDKWNAVLIASGFILLTYLFSSWYVWHFGCSFGQRSFIEFYPFLALPFAYFVNNFSFRSPVKWTWLLVVAFFITYELILTYNYPECFMDESWNWQYLVDMVFY